MLVVLGLISLKPGDDSDSCMLVVLSQTIASNNADLLLIGTLRERCLLNIHLKMSPTNPRAIVKASMCKSV